MNTSLRFDSGYTAVIDSTTDGLFVSRKEERFFTAENRPGCYDEVRHLAARALRVHRKTGQQTFRMTHKGFSAVIIWSPSEILVDTSIEEIYIGRFWFAIN